MVLRFSKNPKKKPSPHFFKFQRSSDVRTIRASEGPTEFRIQDPKKFRRVQSPPKKLTERRYCTQGIHTDWCILVVILFHITVFDANFLTRFWSLYQQVLLFLVIFISSPTVVSPVTSVRFR